MCQATSADSPISSTSTCLVRALRIVRPGRVPYPLCADNKLASLPPNIGALVKIQRLFLHQNHFIALPSSIGRLRSLVQFYLHCTSSFTLGRPAPSRQYSSYLCR